MTQVGTVNYHVHKPERQAFEIDPGGVVGCLVSPELVATDVRVLDERDEVSVRFQTDSVAFEKVPSVVTDFTGTSW